MKLKYNKAKEDVAKQTNLLTNYRNAYELSSGLNHLVSSEDNLYKKALYDREQKLMFYQKEQAKERNKFSDAMQGNTLSKILNI